MNTNMASRDKIDTDSTNRFVSESEETGLYVTVVHWIEKYLKLPIYLVS